MLLPYRVRLLALLAAAATAAALVVLTANPAPVTAAAATHRAARLHCGINFPEEKMNCAARAVNHHHRHKARTWATKRAVRQMVHLRKSYRFGLDASCTFHADTATYGCQGTFYKGGHADGYYIATVGGTAARLMVTKVIDSPHD